MYTSDMIYQPCFGRRAYRPLTEKDMTSVSLAGGSDPPTVRDTSWKLSAVYMVADQRNL